MYRQTYQSTLKITNPNNLGFGGEPNFKLYVPIPRPNKVNPRSIWFVVEYRVFNDVTGYPTNSYFNFDMILNWGVGIPDPTYGTLYMLPINSTNTTNFAGDINTTLSFNPNAVSGQPLDNMYHKAEVELINESVLQQAFSPLREVSFEALPRLDFVFFLNGYPDNFVTNTSLTLATTRVEFRLICHYEAFEDIRN